MFLSPTNNKNRTEKVLGSIRQHSFIPSVSQSMNECVLLIVALTQCWLSESSPSRYPWKYLVVVCFIYPPYSECQFYVYTFVMNEFDWYSSHTHVFCDEIWFTLFGEWKFLVSLCSFPVIVVLIVVVVVVVVVIIVVCHCNHYCCDTFYTVFAVCVCWHWLCMFYHRQKEERQNVFSLWNRILYLVSLPEWMSIFKCNFKTNSKHTHTHTHSLILPKWFCHHYEKNK